MAMRRLLQAKNKNALAMTRCFYIMNENHLKYSLNRLKFGVLRYFDSIGSTNDEALAWAADGAPDLSIVLADEQTSGRGRLNRKWFTPKGTALAFSLILRPAASLRPYLSRVAGLAALSITDALALRGLDAQIKWPNDILINGEKVAGILVETTWTGEDVDAVVIGVGVNVMQAAVPPADLLTFPATSIENLLGGIPDREQLFHDILAGVNAWLPRMDTDSFIKAWNEKLAFRGEQVQIHAEGDPIIGELSGLELDGSLRLRDAHGNSVVVRFGDASLRPDA